MRANKELAEKVGLLPGMSIFKFFRITYGHYGKLIYPNEKAKKPHTYSHVFINSGYHYSEKAENDFIRYFTDDLRLKKNAKKLLSSDLSLDKRKEETPFF